MDTEKRTQILRLLDRERREITYPGVTRFLAPCVIRDVSADGGSGEIVYSSCSGGEVDAVIAGQIETARSAGYELEWKVYGHDQPESLGERLVSAGFVAGDREQFMVFSANDASLDRFDGGDADIRRVTTPDGLRDYQTIREEVSGRSCAREVARCADLLENHPDDMSIYVAYVDAEPAACGRVYFHPASAFAGLYGGSTRERFRKRGLFLQVVGARIREAVGREIVEISVDALPTSEPILRKRGFESVTYTQPFTFSP